MLDVQAVCEIIHKESRSGAPCMVTLEESGGCRLAEPIHMDLDAPPFDRALVDGYALAAAAAPAGAQLRILGRQDAGSDAQWEVGPGTCVAINTGAPLPKGADAVIMVEETHIAGAAMDTAAGGRSRTHASGLVLIKKATAPGAGLQRRGSDARVGQEVLPAGAILTPVALAVAAAAGAAQVRVVPMPRVAVLVTGDELVEPGTVPSAAQIRNTNSAMLAACVRMAGASLVYTGTAGDDREKLGAAIQSALKKADVLIVSGGMSMGTRDLVPDMLLELGFHLHVQKVRIKPGKPFLFGTREPQVPSPARQYVLGLPGNPVSAFVCFQRFGRIVLDCLAGGSGEIVSRRMPLTAPTKANGDREFYLPAIVDTDSQGQDRSTPLSWGGSADIFSLARANALIILPPISPALAAGDFARVMVWAS